MKLAMASRVSAHYPAGLIYMLCLIGFALSPNCGWTQEPSEPIPTRAGNASGDKAELQPTTKVEVQPVARDSEIESRLESILIATEWFDLPDVEVREGVVFLRGSTTSEQHMTWAGDLARRTQDVAAVVNKIEIQRRSLWDLGPAQQEIEDLSRSLVLALPNIVLSLLVLAIAWWVGKLATSVGRKVAARRLTAPLLSEVLSRVLGFLVFLIGLYLVLRISGLTRLAVTVLGGTGLIGLVIGIAFRDITENFLASIFLSIQQPFQTGDLIEINGVLGYVQRLTTRTTILMTLDGNHVQVPNTTVYKSSIQNFTSNPNRRETFTIGIGYADVISEAQELALEILRGHPAVLKNPEPWVLVDSLGTSTVNLKVYFWLNGAEHSWLKARSSAIRLIKRAYQDRGISMPDEAREVVFPRGVPVEISRVRKTMPDQQPLLPPQPLIRGKEIPRLLQVTCQIVGFSRNACSRQPQRSNYQDQQQ
ncbi:MAG: mechanosensitive ion channel [Pirellulaceae bacterium]|nr:mechanosensitive ion channel [Pirellulaceae bacterium]